PVFDRPVGAAIVPGFDNDNVLGNPDPAVIWTATTDADFFNPVAALDGSPQASWPAYTPYDDMASPYVPPHGPEPATLPQGLFLRGPRDMAPLPFAAGDPFANGNNGLIPPATPVLRTANLQYSRLFPVRQPADLPDERTQGITVILRRLANPYLPFNGQRKE